MFKHPFVNGIKGILQALTKPIQRFANQLVAALLRLLFSLSQHSYRPQGGFILPTTVLLVLVVSLAVGTISLRTYQRTQQVIGDREQRVIYNIATPALDRARAKFEYLFQGDPRFPSGVPSEGVMNSLLLDGSNLLPGVADAYVLSDETKLDINEDGTTDAAWSYRTDTDEDGVDDATVAYAIILQTPRPGDPYQMSDSSDAALVGRADELQVRNAPLSGSRQLVDACQLNDIEVPLEQGWFRDEASSAVLRKNLQVDVYVQPDDPAQTLATLEFQQDRQLDQGNKWGAWFRGDIDISPGPEFNWNGAMHTEGSLMVARTGSSSENRKFTGYLVSAPNSCIYTADASEITVADTDADPGNGIPEFRGQVIGAKAYDTNFDDDDESIFHLFDTPAVTTGDDKVLLDKSGDSVKNNQGYGPADFSLDPLLLATQGISQARDAAIDFNTVYDQTTWESNPINQQHRIYSQSEDPPYLDDFFRADDRFGPNPRYGDVAIPASRTIGDEITGNLLSSEGLSDQVLTREDASSDDADSVGLDGYWERRARQNGLRLITGQRLELGDAFGWGGLDQAGQRRSGDEEPLKPWDGCVGSNNTGRCNEARHRLTLRDNLAAVQATAVYHSSSGTPDDDTPAACWSSTVHPGTPSTLRDSSTFRDLSAGLGSFWPAGNWFAGKPLISNFFLGEGTNGWEYGVHPNAAIDGNSDATVQALQNLAYYAGDPNGGAPSFPPVQDNVVHPYPDMAMWGDFSVLRRIFDELWSGGYVSLSIADKATLRSAACTVGMLAYNVGYLENLDDDPANDPTGLIPDLDDRLGLLSQASGTTTDGQARPNTTALPQLSSLDPPEAYIEGLEEWNILDSAAVSSPMVNLAKLLMFREQLERDRLFGFQDGLQGAEDDFSGGFSGGTNWTNNWTITPTNNGDTSDVTTPGGALQIRDDGLQVSRTVDLSGIADPVLSFDYRRDSLDSTSETVTLEISTDGINFSQLDVFRGSATDATYQSFSIDISTYISPTTTIRFVSSNNLSDGDRFWVDNVNVGRPYASSACFGWSTDLTIQGLEQLCTDYPKYPILNALFPFSDHDEVAKQATSAMATRDGAIPAYIQTENANTAIQYRSIDLTSDTILNAIALEPTDFDQWVLPHGSLNNGSNPNSNQEQTVVCVDAVCGSGTGNREFVVPFKDTALMNGRERMAVRVLNMDVDLLRSSGSNLSNDFWLPNSGLMYAFREDAVREDEIVRPRSDTWANCNVNGKYETDSTCRMAIDANAYDSTDPPLNPDNLISPKVVDYYADPDRRPYGFRLVNGQKINRGNNPRGMSLISDSPVYIQGDFNLHQTTSCNGTDNCRVEEFTDKLNASDFSNFYTRSTLDTDFARSNTDLWRPAEILTDAVTILSDNFCDGSYIDGWLTAGEGVGLTLTSGDEGVGSSDYGCAGNGDRTSFLNFMRPEASIATTAWHHEDPFDNSSPVAITRHGDPLFISSGTLTEYGNGTNDYFEAASDFTAASNNNLAAGIREKDTRVNAVMISGVVPMRYNQSYGGLHNFPRFISEWVSSSGTQQALNIAGAFFQLNYSNYATGPFDQDAFETNQDPSVNLSIPYYVPPKRLWGYDVGLQYAKAGPISQRFVSASALRSEFYSEPAASDPYMVNLCRAMIKADSGDPDVSCAS